MEPRIQYARTSDGVSIAYTVLGEGEPLVFMPNFAFARVGVEPEHQDPRIPGMYERLTERRKLISYDHRGGGMSDRNVTDFSLDAQILDLEAVVDGLGLETFALCGAANSGPAAIAYAARQPERVSHLILWSAWARAADWSHSPQFSALRGLLYKDWETYTETYAHIALGWSAGAEAHRVAALMRESITQEAMQAWAAAVSRFDVTHLLSKVSSPTLVLHPRQDAILPVDVARSLASRIPDARLVLVEGESPRFFGDREAVLTAIDEFLGEAERTVIPAEVPAAMTAILFADVADSTSLTERLGDVAFREKARALDAALRGVIRENGGAPVEGKLLGDGVLAVFTSARHAIEAALACGRTGDEAGLPLHLGLHAGDVIREEGNVYGGAVNIAARISALSAPGEVLVSGTVRSLARTSAGVSFEDRGERDLKGVGEPVRMWAVRAQESA